MTPLVSVVIPTYNAPHLLLQTLDSVFAQTFDDYEVVIVNDGSTDDTLARLDPLQQRHGQKMRIVTQTNGGIGVARNRGLDEARGKYVALLDHDDLWMPHKLAVQVEYLRRMPQCVACGGLYALSTQPDRPHFRFEDVADEQGIVHRPFWEPIHGRDVFLTSTLMVERERIRGIRYGTERRCIEDVQFHIKLMGRGLFGLASRELLATYRIFEGNSSKDPLFYFKGVKLLRDMLNRGEFADLPSDQRKDAARWIAHIGRFSSVLQIGIGQRGRGLELYRQEFLPQLREGRLRFLAIYPWMLLLPKKVIDAVYRWRSEGKSNRKTAPGEAITQE